MRTCHWREKTRKTDERCAATRSTILNLRRVSMGSDAIQKSNRPTAAWRYMYIALVLTSIIFMIAFWTWKPATFSSDEASIPPRCHQYAARFHSCQAPRNPHTLVIACHRKWCGSWGYCSPGGGLGSRTRYALSILERAFQQCVQIQVDAPSNALLTAKEATYHDPMGLVAELLHFRSYGKKVEDSRETWKGNTSDWMTTKETFLHFTPRHWTSPRPDGMPAFDYDPCLFHLLFQPSPLLREEISKHYTAIALGDHQQEKVIGIHFRTGDAVAFHHLSGGDVRVSSTVDFTHALDQLVECASTLATELGLHNATRFYLATDNKDVQDLAQQRDGVVTLNLQRHSWRHHDEFDAWLEVFLLSKMKGIVVNELDDKNYRGVGDRISTFARLAAKIGFMEEARQVYPCKLH